MVNYFFFNSTTDDERQTALIIIFNDSLGSQLKMRRRKS